MLQWMQFNVKFPSFWWLCNIENDLTPAVACNKIQHFLKKQDEEMDRKTDISKMQCSHRKCITLFGFKSAFHLLVFPSLHLLWYAQTQAQAQWHKRTSASKHHFVLRGEIGTKTHIFWTFFWGGDCFNPTIKRPKRD